MSAPGQCPHCGKPTRPPPPNADPCPACGGRTRVVKVVPRRGGRKRRRECAECGQRFTTYRPDAAG